LVFIIKKKVKIGKVKLKLKGNCGKKNVVTFFKYYGGVMFLIPQQNITI